jgi:hypothetical protein
MDVFSVATEILGETTLSPGQLAGLRAINTRFYLQVHDLLRGPDGRSEARDLTEAETAALRGRLEADILEILSPAQRRALDRPSS